MEAKTPGGFPGAMMSHAESRRSQDERGAGGGPLGTPRSSKALPAISGIPSPVSSWLLLQARNSQEEEHLGASRPSGTS